uniref:Actin maturation protease n=1 Tax=Strigamia maritima TaxID=126957 RepID=T1J5T9_STRMM
MSTAFCTLFRVPYQVDASMKSTSRLKHSSHQAHHPAPIPPPPPPDDIFPSSYLEQAFSTNFHPCIKLTAQDEVAIACKKMFRNQLHDSLCLVACYKKIDAVIQNGPTCGLVALQMATQLFHPNRVPAIDEILTTAQNEGYTIQGEMFSASDMSRLARKLLHCETSVLNDGLASRHAIVQHILRGDPILVPYDADFNFEPCCKRGHKAHWAVVAGVIIAIPKAAVTDLRTYELNSGLTNLFHATEKSDKEALASLCQQGTLYILAKQGKSNWLGLWLYDNLQLSNSNLIEMDPNRVAEGSKYHLPKGGVVEGLCNQIVLLKKPQ